MDETEKAIRKIKNGVFVITFSLDGINYGLTTAWINRASFKPNMIMASIAIGYAVNVNADEVALGVHAGDHAIYPDCRPEFVFALRNIAEIANFKPIEIYAPFLFIIPFLILEKKLISSFSFISVTLFNL